MKQFGSLGQQIIKQGSLTTGLSHHTSVVVQFKPIVLFSVFPLKCFLYSNNAFNNAKPRKHMEFDKQNFDEFTVVFIGKLALGYKDKLIDKLLAIQQIHQHFPLSNFCAR